RVISSQAGSSHLDLGGGEAVIATPLQVGEKVAIAVRGERVAYGSETRYGFNLPGEILKHSYIGGTLRTFIRLPQGQVLRLSGSNPIFDRQEGSQVQVYWDPQVANVVEHLEL
ncbi:MAG: TOBE domain-containing protein, partial [Symbiobacteriaceae bacterium]|nr:TOBE domain-containing protein [Symbiobacteriaceae bacterium]